MISDSPGLPGTDYPPERLCEHGADLNRYACGAMAAGEPCLETDRLVSEYQASLRDVWKRGVARIGQGGP